MKRAGGLTRRGRSHSVLIPIGPAIARRPSLLRGPSFVDRKRAALPLGAIQKAEDALLLRVIHRDNAKPPVGHLNLS